LDAGNSSAYVIRVDRRLMLLNDLIQINSGRMEKRKGTDGRSSATALETAHAHHDLLSDWQDARDRG
jgi:hypothetical protein